MTFFNNLTGPTVDIATRILQSNEGERHTDWLSQQQVLAITLTGFVFYLTARLGLQLQFSESYASPVWPTSSIAIAAMIWLGFRAGIGILVGAFLANLTEFFLRDTGLPFSLAAIGSYIVEQPATVWSSFIIAIGHTLEAIICISALKSFGNNDRPLNNVNNVSIFIISTLTACAINASIAAYYYIDMKYLDSGLLYKVWFTWWSGDIIGILFATPFLLFFKIKSPIQYFYERPLIHILSLILLLLLCGLTFIDWSTPNFFIAQSYLFIPLLLWINFKCGRTITLAVLLVSVIALWGTMDGHGPFISNENDISLILLQGFIASLLITMLLQDAILKEREEAIQQVKISNQALKNSADMITASKQLAEDKIRQTEKDARIKSEFLTTLSHEIRTPMSGIIGMMDLLRDTNLDEEQEEYMDTIRYSAESLLIVINDILDYSKVEDGKLQLEETTYNLHSLIKNSLAMFRSEINEKNILFTYRVDPYIPQWVIGDPNRLKQVMTNLISNAIKYTPDGEININTDLLIDNDHNILIEVSIHDTGIGIHSEALNTIFESSHLAESGHTRRYGGTGLGLAIVKNLVTLMGGEIKVESCPMSGSTFTFTTRLKKVSNTFAPEADEKTSAESDTPNIDSTKTNVLLVEDNKINQIVTTRMLTKIGYQVDVVDNGMDAISAAQNHSYDIILMDCQMPIMDGFQATRKLKELQQTKCINNVPIIALTANAMAGDQEKCLEVGMSDYLSKPLLIEELASTLNKWIDTSRKKRAKDYNF